MALFLLQGSVGGPLTLTAYIVTILLEEESKCSSTLKQRIVAAVQDAVQYLIRNKDSSTFRRPFGLSLLSYALALAQPLSPITTRTLEKLVLESK